MSEFELLGIRATTGPLFFTPLRLQAGLNVLYGLNGAGKSALLNAVHAGLAGRPAAEDYLQKDWQVTVLLRVTGDGHHPIQSAFKPRGTGRSAAEARALKVLENARENRQYGASAQLPDLDRQAAVEVASQRLIALSPVGVAEPAWNAFVAADRSAGPAVLAIFDAESEFSVAHMRWNHGQLSPMLQVTGMDESTLEDDDLEFYSQVFHSVFNPQRGIPSWSTSGFTDDGVIVDDGLPWQVAPIAAPWVNELYKSPVYALVEDHDLTSLDEDTRQALAGHWWGRGSAERPSLHDDDETRGWVDALDSKASQYFALFLLDAPRLKLDIGDPANWLRGTHPRWTDEHGVPLQRFSRAEARWASMAIRLALGRQSGGRVVLLLDEPEAALHRTAEAHLAKGLQRLASEEGLQIVVATHSPELLNAPSAHVSRVHKEYGRPYGPGTRGTVRGLTQVTSLTTTDLSDMEALGLNPSDLLRTYRVFLLVEGHHEELIFGAVLGERLAAARAHIMPIRGATQLAATVDSRFLYDFTDAQIVAVIDNMRSDRLRDTWEEALVVAASEGVPPAITFLGAALPNREGAETRFMQQFLSRAIQKGTTTTSRITPFSFAKADITDYLPLEALLPETGDASWESLRSDYAATGGQYRNFKDWVQGVHGRKVGRDVFSDLAILGAAAAMELPDEFAMFAAAVERAANRPIAPVQ